MKNMFLTTFQMAKCLGFTRQHVRLLIRQKKLPALKVGRDWLTLKTDFQLFVKQHHSVSVEVER